MNTTNRRNKNFSDTMEWLTDELADLCDVYGKIPSQRQLAKLNGCSLGTMRKAISALEDRGFLSTRHGHGTFLTQESHVQQQVSAIQENLAVLIPIGTTVTGEPRAFPAYLYEMCLGMKRRAEEFGYNLLLKTFEYDSENKEKQIKEFIHLVNRESCAGVVLSAVWQKDVQQRIYKCGKPGIIADHWAESGVKWDSIEPATADHIEEMITLLVNMGHRKITLFVRENDHNPAILSGYRQALSNLRDEEVAGDLVEIPQRRSLMKDCFLSLVDKWTDSPECPHAIVSPNPSYLDMLNDILKDSSIKIPEDISFVGFPTSTAVISNELSGIIIDWQEFGHECIDKLVERVKDSSKPVEVIKKKFPFQFGETISVRSEVNV